MSPKSWAIAFAGDRVLLKVEGEVVRMPTRQELTEAVGQEVLQAAHIRASIGSPKPVAASAFSLPEGFAVPDGYRLESLRVAYHGLTEVEFRAAGTARQKVHWHRTHSFCSRCGAVCEKHADHEAMACSECGQLHFARVAPAVIVLVEKGNEMLLGRSPHFAEGVYSTLAGFVEPGESLEECVHREVEEEAGVRVANLRYFGSQPHPFPNSLMVGFIADWLSGDIQIDPKEIEDARWFTRSDLPELPHPMSIARKLIEDFLRRHED